MKNNQTPRDLVWTDAQLQEACRLARFVPPPELQGDKLRKRLLHMLPECFGTVENGRPVRDLELKDSKNCYSCRNDTDRGCVVTDLCAQFVEQPTVDAYLKDAQHAVRPVVHHVFKIPSRPPARGSKVRFITERVLAAKYTRDELMRKLDKRFGGKTNLRAYLSIMSNPTQKAYIGVIGTDAHDRLYFKNAEDVRKLLLRN